MLPGRSSQHINNPENMNTSEGFSKPSLHVGMVEEKANCVKVSNKHNVQGEIPEMEETWIYMELKPAAILSCSTQM